MKKTYLFIFVALMATLVGCTSKATYEYIPCKVDKGDDWGFVNAKGDVYCKDMFKNLPSPVVEGLFFVEEGNAYTLYTFDKKKPVALVEDLKAVGCPSDGILPICRKGSRIEVINTKGKTLFTLEKIANQEVTACESSFKHGYMVVTTMDENGSEYEALIDTKGEVVLKPSYKSIGILSKNLFYVSLNNDGETEYRFINAKGEKQSQWKDIDIECVSDKYICAQRDDRYYVYNMKGEEILKCTDRVEDIESIKDNYFVFEGEDGTGVMDIKGEKILTDKYYAIQILEGGKFLVKKESDSKYELMNNKGESIKKIEDFEYVAYAEDFGCIGYENNRYYVCNNKFEYDNQKEYFNIDFRSFGYVVSDYFDYSAICQTVETFITSGMNNKGIRIGNSPADIPLVQNKDLDNISSYTHYVYEDLAQGLHYTIDLSLEFSSYVKEEKYIEKQVQEYDWYYGYYTTTRRVSDGYRLSSSARLEEVEIDCDVPRDKAENLNEELAKMLNRIAAVKRDGYMYTYGNLIIELEETTITIYKEVPRAETYAYDYDYVVDEVDQSEKY